MHNSEPLLHSCIKQVSRVILSFSLLIIEVLTAFLALMNTIRVMLFVCMFAILAVKSEGLRVETWSLAVPKLPNVFWSRRHELKSLANAASCQTWNRCVRNVAFILFVVFQKVTTEAHVLEKPKFSRKINLETPIS